MLTSRWLAAFAVALGGACGDTSGCNTAPLPEGGLPIAQTLEGGAQIRITRQGFQKLTSVVPDLINAQLTDGFCVPEGTEATVHYCYEDQGPCTAGCQANLSLNQTQFVATNNQTLTLRLDLAVNATIPADASGFDPCYLYATGDHLYGDADIELVPDPTTGALTVELTQIRNVDLSRLDVTGSGGFCSGASAFADFLKSYFAQTIADYITPQVNELIQGFLPDPLGIEGVVDVGALLAAISPGTSAGLEARLIPGGFATVYGNSQLQITGATLGVITGINSDRDPTTRGSAASEPALCVPPILPPLLSAAPYSLAQTPRSTFLLPAAPGFSGAPDPLGRDLSIGISERLLDLVGHHAVASGAGCLGIGTALVPQLNVGTFGVLVPSVSELGNDDGNDPILLVTRPQKAIDFAIGDNNAQSPALTMSLHDFEIDVYAFLFERYTRVFTMTATLDVGVNLETEQVPDTGTWQLKPTLVGLSSSDVTITVTNDQFVAESRAQLEGALPSVFDLLVTQLAIPPIDVPTFAGFAIGAPSITKVSSPESDFLAINANLDVTAAPAHGAKSTGRAVLRSVATPPIESIRAALAGDATGALPAVTLDVDRVDSLGRELEWSWRIGRGLWHPYTTAAPLAIDSAPPSAPLRAPAKPGLAIADRAFAWQGAFTIGVMSRVRGDQATASGETVIPVVIDSVGPHVTSKTGWTGDRYTVHGFDVVGTTAIRIAFGRPGDAEPRTAWTSGARAELSRGDLADLVVGGDLAVFLVDERGNQTIALAQPFHGQAGASGCSCETGGGGATWLLAFVTLFGVVRSRRRR